MVKSRVVGFEFGGGDESESVAGGGFNAADYVDGLVDGGHAVFLSGAAGDGGEGFPAMGVDGVGCLRGGG